MARPFGNGMLFGIGLAALDFFSYPDGHTDRTILGRSGPQGSSTYRYATDPKRPNKEPKLVLLIFSRPYRQALPQRAAAFLVFLSTATLTRLITTLLLR